MKVSHFGIFFSKGIRLKIFLQIGSEKKKFTKNSFKTYLIIYEVTSPYVRGLQNFSNTFAIRLRISLPHARIEAII